MLLEKLKNHKFLEESLDMVKKSSKVEDLSKGVKRKTKTELVYIFLKKTLNDWDIYLEVSFIIFLSFYYCKDNYFIFYF